MHFQHPRESGILVGMQASANDFLNLLRRLLPLRLPQCELSLATDRESPAWIDDNGSIVVVQLLATFWIPADALARHDWSQVRGALQCH